MGFSLDVEDLRICLNEVDEVGHQIELKNPFFILLIENRCLGWRRKVELSGVFEDAS